MLHRATHFLVRIRNSNPSDVVAGVLATLAVDAVLLSIPLDVFAQTVVALPLLVFLPGYFVVAVLFPRASATYTAVPWISSVPRDERVDLFERLALSYGVSLTLLPLAALGLSLTPWGVALVPVVATLSAVVVLAAPLAVMRRDALPPEESFAFPFRTWLSTAANGVPGGGFADAVVNVSLAAVVLSALAVTGGVILFPHAQNDYTELTLLTENAQGDLVADDYPDTVEAGEPISLVLAVENEGDRPVAYVVVAQVQRVDGNGDVLERKRVKRFERSVAGGDTWRVDHQVTTSLVGDRLRLTYLLYTGDPAETPTRENADRSVHVWLSSTGGS